MPKTKQSFRKPGQLRAFFALAWYAFLAQTRNPASFFFGFLFPIAFISIFGLIGNTPVSFTVGIPETSSMDNPIVEAIENQEVATVETGTEDELKQLLEQGEVGGIVTVEETEGNTYAVSLTLSTGLPQEAGMIQALVTNIVDRENLTLSGVTDPPISLTREEIEGRQPRYIDFALPGQIGFAMLSTAIFGTVFGLIYLKKALILKRMFATPTRALTILLAQGTSRLFIAILQVILILGIGVLFFQFYLPHGVITFLTLLVAAIIGLIAFLGFGYFLAGISNDENSAGPIVNLVTLPQFLLSGTFFPTESLPQWIQPVANNLPLSYFNMAMREIANEGATLVDVWPYLLGLLFWGVFMYLLASRTFRWQ